MRETPPGKTLVVGASYIALECGGFLAGLGNDVTVMVRSILLRGFDRDIADKIGEFMADAKPNPTKFIKGKVPQSIEKLASGRLLVRWEGNPDGEEFDTVLGAIGRNADTHKLGLEKAGVVAEKNGKIKCVNEQTNVSNIYAIGDVVYGCPELTPVAIQAGRLLADRLYSNNNVAMDYNTIATTVFTPLEYGAIGMSEEEAVEFCGGESEIEVFHSNFTPLEWTVCENRPQSKCYAKLVCDKREGQNLKVLGLHILGPNAGEITQGYSVAMRLGATYQDFQMTVGIHPTVSEEFTTISVTKSSGKDADAGGC